MSKNAKKIETDAVKWWDHYAKGIVAFAVTALGGAVAEGLIVGRTAAEVTFVIGVLTTTGVVAKRNY